MRRNRGAYVVHDLDELACVGDGWLDRLQFLQKGVVLLVDLVDLVLASHEVQARGPARPLHVPRDVQRAALPVALVGALSIIIRGDSFTESIPLSRL